MNGYAMRKCAFAIPFLLAVVPAQAKDTGLIYVSNEKSNNIIVLDPKTYKIVNDIKVSRRPRDMHFNADHTKLYIACGDADVIDVLDVAKGEVTGKIATGSSPETFAIDEQHRRLYVSDEEFFVACHYRYGSGCDPDPGADRRRA